MPSLKGVVDLDYKSALSGLREFRGEFKTTAREVGGLKAGLDTTDVKRGTRVIGDEARKQSTLQKEADKAVLDEKKRLLNQEKGCVRRR